MAASDMVKNKKYVLEAPDGGWGYCIAIAVIILFATITTIWLQVFGLLFNDFLEEIHMNSTTVTLLTGVMAVCYAISGFLTGPLLKIMSKRKLALLAAIIFDVGLFGNVFAYSTPVFFVCQGIMHGVGLGILYNITCTVLNDYFVKKRLFMTSLVQTIIAFIAMCTPKVVKWSLDEYGYRGTLLLVAGVMLNNLVAIALLQPVEWHMKKVEITNEKEERLLLQNDKKYKDEISEGPIVTLTDAEGQVKSLGILSETKRSKAIMRVVEMFLDVKLFKEIIISLAVLGPGLSVFADTTFNLILPQALYFDGWDNDYVALALSLSGFGDLAGRIFLVCTSKCISKLGMLWSKSATTILVCIGIIGFARSTLMTLIPMVLAEVVSPEKFTSAMGIFLLIGGAMNLILGPAIGAVRDLTKSYTTAFYILISVIGAVILFWSIEICFKRNKHKRDARKEYLQRNTKK